MTMEMDNDNGWRLRLMVMEMAMDKWTVTTMEGDKWQGKMIDEQMTGRW